MQRHQWLSFVFCVSIVVLVALLVQTEAVRRHDNRPVLDNNMIRLINHRKTSWTASRNSRFEGITIGEARRLLGTHLKPRGTLDLPKQYFDASLGALPTTFDARQRWPGCIHPVRDQQQCGSCWAFGATEALSDRFCIGSNSTINVVLSPEDLVACDSSDYGCNGGYLDNAWNYMKNTGVVADTCFPYTSGDGSQPPCPSNTCPGTGSWKKYHAKTVVDVSSTVSAIQQEIYTNGPVEAAFDVYDDFFSYSGGVYTHQSGSLAGGHAIKILGWGTLNGVDYWLCQNSWGTSWGLQGFFLIKRGTDECGIEDNVVAGLAAVSAEEEQQQQKPQEPHHHANALNQPALDDGIISYVNSVQKSWKAGRNARFEGKTLADVMHLLRTHVDPFVTVGQRVVLPAPLSGIPTSFDSRTQWPGCVHPIRDQQQCGSCWAFGATESLSDRFCVASNGTVNVVLSPEYLVSCDTTDYGCQGGYLQNAWEFMSSTGVPTDSCFPYTAGGGNPSPCASKCTDGSAMKMYKAQGSTVKTVSDVASIQTAIMTSGPVEASFMVYQDFISYKSGVYKHTTGSFLGGHAIKAIGWGVSNGQAYWIMANSWNTSWGMNGYFWIARGNDECGIEENVVFGSPAL